MPLAPSPSLVLYSVHLIPCLCLLPCTLCPHHSSASLLHSSSIPLSSSSSLLVFLLPLWLGVPVCLYVTSVKLSGSQAKVNSPAPGSGVMGAEMFFLRNQGTPGGFWLGPGRGQGGEDDPLSCPPKERTLTSLSFFLFQSWSSAFCHFPPHRSVCGSLILHLSAFCVGICVHSPSAASASHIYSHSSSLLYTLSFTVFSPKHSSAGTKKICTCVYL